MHLTWYKCCPHWDDVQWPWPRSTHQRSRSHNTLKGHSTHARVRTITYVCIDRLPSNLVQMLSSLRPCALTLTGSIPQRSRSHKTFNKSRTHFPSFLSQNNLDIDLTYTTHNLNNFNKYPSMTCSYIQEYLGYLSNHLYFLFPILDQWKCTILVKFNVPVRLRDKQNVLKKQQRGIISRPLYCLVVN